MQQPSVNMQGWHNHLCVSMWVCVCVHMCDTVCVCTHLSTVNKVRPRAKNYVHLCPRGECVSGWRWEAQGGSTAQVASSGQAESRRLGTRVPYRPRV